MPHYYYSLFTSYPHTLRPLFYLNQWFFIASGVFWNSVVISVVTMKGFPGPFSGRDGGVLRGTVPQEEDPIPASSLTAAPASCRELRVELSLLCECQVFGNTCPLLNILGLPAWCQSRSQTVLLDFTKSWSPFGNLHL